jgi:fructokinase
LVSRADVVKVSDEDLGWLYPGKDPAGVIRTWLETGPAVVVLTRGPRGATGVCEAGAVELAAPAVAVVDTVGAGDAFMSGLLDHLAGAGLLGVEQRATLRAIGLDELQDTVRHAVTVAAFTCTRPGAQPPTRKELVAWSG